MSHSNKPLTFAVMLIRAQRRLEAIGKVFPAARAMRAAAGAATRHEGPAGAKRTSVSALHAAVAG